MEKAPVIPRSLELCTIKGFNGMECTKGFGAHCFYEEC